VIETGLKDGVEMTSVQRENVAHPRALEGADEELTSVDISLT
jgi:hypothetical protein